MARTAGDTRSSNLDRQLMVPRRIAGAPRVYPLPPVGTRIGTITITGFTYGARGGIRTVTVQCDCRRTAEVCISNLRAGRTTRCNACAKDASGAARSRHYGFAAICPDAKHRSRLLDRVSAVFSRCYALGSNGYKDYGGRGITVFWPNTREGRQDFLRHLVSLPGWDDPDLEIDRTNNDGHYAPNNLRFATRSEQNANKRYLGRRKRRSKK